MLSFVRQLVNLCRPNRLIHTNPVAAEAALALQHQEWVTPPIMILGSQNETDDWHDPCTDSQRIYVTLQLKQAQAIAQQQPLGTSFTYRLTGMSEGVLIPREISEALSYRALEYGLSAGLLSHEGVEFTRIR